MGGVNPFELEKHASLYMMPSTNREPSIYVSDDSEFAGNFADVSTNGDYRSDEPMMTNGHSYNNDSRPYSLSEFADMDPEFTPQPTSVPDIPRFPQPYQDQPPPLLLTQPTPESEYPLPLLPPAPSARVMQGQASSDDVKEELRRLAMSLGEHLSYVNAHISNFPVRRGSAARIEPLREVL
jgi:hypothetical protein